jgi:4-amino-4-deoxy-L-arabinose transferase-like glycosyltransferase
MYNPEMQSIRAILKDRKTWILLAILGLGAYLRLWNIEHLFNAVHDYDEAVYTLGARFITEGFLPYRDFNLVHPPFYSLVLAAIFKIFGYSYFYAKYFSVFISLASVVLIYFTGKKISYPGAGLVAAGLFAVSPDMVYFGRRAVQESLSIFLLLLALYFIFSFLKSRKNSSLLWCGLVLGLLFATKYIFAPALIGIFLATLLLLMGDRFTEAFSRLAKPSFLLTYLCIIAGFISVLLLLSWSLHLSIPVPFFSSMLISPATVTVAVLVFIIPFILAILVTEKKIAYREWFLAFWQIIRKRDIWYLVAGGVIGFMAVTGYFWIVAPREFLNQTVLLQYRSNVTIPAILAMLQNIFYLSSYYGRLSYLPVLLSIPVALVLLNKRNRSPSDGFISIAMLTALVFCQAFLSAPRYSVSVYPFLLLALGGIVKFDSQLASQKLRSLAPGIKAGFFSVAAVFVLFMSSSIILLTNYSGYDINSPSFTSNEEEVYQQTINYLESASPKKLFSFNPIFPAMSPKLQTTLDVDPFASIYLKREPAAKIVQDKIDEGVDYIVIDAWVRWWDNPVFDDLIKEVQRQCRLVTVIAPDSTNRTEIYLVTADKTGVFNGDFAQWVTDGKTKAPIGWQPAISAGTIGNGDSAGISKSNIAGKDCIKLDVQEDGSPDGNREATQVGVYQEISFPQKNLVIDVLPTSNTRSNIGTTRPTGIHFVDLARHNLIFGFSDSIDSEQLLMSPDGNSVLVLRPARLGEWSRQTIDLASYWSKTTWGQPKDVSVWLITSADDTEPGTYDLYVASVEEE